MIFDKYPIFNCPVKMWIQYQFRHPFFIFRIFFYSMALLSFSKSFHETIKIASFLLLPKRMHEALFGKKKIMDFFWYGERKITFNDNWIESMPKLQFDDWREEKTPLWLLKDIFVERCKHTPILNQFQQNGPFSNTWAFVHIIFFV